MDSIHASEEMETVAAPSDASLLTALLERMNDHAALPEELQAEVH